MWSGGRQYLWFWVRIFVVVGLVLFIIQLLRVNRPEKTATTPFADIYTSGIVVDGEIVVMTGSFRTFPINLNRRARLSGTFSASGQNHTIGCIVLKKEEFEKLSAGAEHSAISKTGDVPGGKIDVMLQPGEYYLVLDNRHSLHGDAIVAADFAIK